MIEHGDEKDLGVYIPYIVLLGALLVASFVAGGFITPSPYTVVTMSP